MPQTFTPRDMLSRLVSFDTTSRDSNLGLVAFVEDYVGAWGLKSRRIPNPEGTKANLLITIGPDIPGGVILSGHTDVVPVDGQPWDTDPFDMVERDGRYYGRGTSDMKAFSAVILSLIPEFVAHPLRTPVHIALSYDEEVGCLGVRPMIADIVRSVPMPRLAIIGEPTNMKVVNAHKGIRSFRTTVTGREAHSSQVDKGVNAVMVAAELIMFLARLADDMRAKGDPTGRFDPPFTSVQSSTIEGGTALNILARECTFQWEYRYLPGTSQDDIFEAFDHHARNVVLPRLKAIAPEADIVTTVRSHAPALVAREGCPAEALARQLTGANHAEAVSYGTEAGLFQEAGIPSVICGPGDIREAHKPNEYIEISQVAACETFIRKLITQLR
ncbi:MAG: acetylornithine deacetylase [Alphaproteobacteria bacterium]